MSDPTPPNPTLPDAAPARTDAAAALSAAQRAHIFSSIQPSRASPKPDPIIVVDDITPHLRRPHRRRRRPPGGSSAAPSPASSGPMARAGRRSSTSSPDSTALIQAPADSTASCFGPHGPHQVARHGMVRAFQRPGTVQADRPGQQTCVWAPATNSASTSWPHSHLDVAQTGAAITRAGQRDARPVQSSTPRPTISPGRSRAGSANSSDGTRALMTDPKIVMLDEPMAGVNPRADAKPAQDTSRASATTGVGGLRRARHGRHPRHQRLGRRHGPGPGHRRDPARAALPRTTRSSTPTSDRITTSASNSTSTGGRSGRRPPSPRRSRAPSRPTWPPAGTSARRQTCRHRNPKGHQ